MNTNSSDSGEYGESTLSLQTFVFFLLAMALGTLCAVIVLPAWMPNLAQSLWGPDPKAFWYLSRGTAFVAMSLLWLSMALGLTITNKMARVWPGAPAAFAVHEYVSLLGLAFTIFHGLILLGDHYMKFSLAQLVLPFATTSYKPLWVGIGQIGFYLWLIVAASFYVRQRIGAKTWRMLHYASFVMYLMGLFHGLFSGTDASQPWAQMYYWISGGSLIFLLVYRILVTVSAKMAKSAPKPSPAARAQ